MVQDCVIFRFNHLARVDYNGSAKFQNGCLAFVSVTEEVMNTIKKSNFEEGKDLIKCHFSKEKYEFLLIELNKPIKF